MLRQRKHPSDRDRAARQRKDESPAAGGCGGAARCRSLGAFFPIVFAEESYEVSTAGEFWLECLSRLADQAPRRDGDVDLHRTFDELRTIHDDRTLEDRCLGVLQDFADREKKRLVLIVENLNMMFRDMGDDDAGWRLRKALQTEPRIVLLASATSRFDQMDDPKEALYELFRVIRLHPLDTEGCAILVADRVGPGAGATDDPGFADSHGRQSPAADHRGPVRRQSVVPRADGRIFSTWLMTIQSTFKSHLDALPAQERKVYLALADLWKPANAREIAERARLGTSKCSAQLARLVDKGAVEVSGGSARRKLYYLTERLYNIYYLMRRARGPAPLIDALIRFMEAYYSTDELREFGARMAREALGFDGGALAIYRMAFERLIGLPTLEMRIAKNCFRLRRLPLGMRPVSFLRYPRRPSVSERNSWGKRWRWRKERSIAGRRGGVGRGHPEVRGKRCTGGS